MALNWNDFNTSETSPSIAVARLICYGCKNLQSDAREPIFKTIITEWDDNEVEQNLLMSELTLN